MSIWLLRLKGDTCDLEELPHWFPTGASYAFSEENSTYVASERFNSHSSVWEVNQEAKVLLNEWHSVINLLWSSFIPPTIEHFIHINEVGERQVHVIAAGANLVGRSKLRVQFSGNSGPTKAQLYLAKAHASPILQEALLLWALPHRSWPRLYRILEELERHLGDRVDLLGMCSKIERSRFSGSANNSLVAGVDARHCGGKYKPPRNPMSISEAETFVSNLIKSCLAP